MRYSSTIIVVLLVAVACTTDKASAGDGATQVADTVVHTPYDAADLPEVRYLLSMGGSSPEDPDAAHVLPPVFVEEDCPFGSCEGTNTAPVLGDPIYEINGELSANLAGVRNGDTLRVLFPFEDAECNLACGQKTTSYVSPEGSGVSSGSMPSNIPCGTSSSDTYLGVYLTIPTFSPPIAGRVDHYEYDVRIDDFCGARAEFSVEFDVAH